MGSIFDARGFGLFLGVAKYQDSNTSGPHMGSRVCWRSILRLSGSVKIVQFGVSKNHRALIQLSLSLRTSIRDSALTESSYIGGRYDAPNSYPLIYNRKPHSRRAALTRYRI